MRRPILLMLAVAMTVVLLAPRGTPVAHACSVGPDFDLVRDSDLIVGGRFTGWDPEGVQLPSEFFDDIPSNVPAVHSAGVRAHMLVDRVFKGRSTSEIDIVSGNTLDIYDHEPKYVWTGPTGACGAFGSDPTGVYAMMGLTGRDDGAYGAAIFTWFYAGQEPPTDFSDRSLSRLDALLPGVPPPGGESTNLPGNDAPLIPIVAAGIAIPLAFLLGATFLWPRRRSTL